MVSEDRGETMQEYLAMLLAISLVLLAFFQVTRKIIPLNTRIIYGTVGISFTLGAFFPVAISNLTPGKVLGIYFGLIAISAIVLSYIENRVSLNVSTAPVRVADLETQNDFTENEQYDKVSIPGTNFDGKDEQVAEAASGFHWTSPAGTEDMSVPEDVTRDELPASDGVLPELSDVDALEQPLLDNMPDLPDSLPEQPVPLADSVPDFVLPPAGIEDMSVPEDVTRDELPASDGVLPELSDVDALEPEFIEQVAASRENLDYEELDTATAATNDDIINDCISAGFEAKARGDLDVAVNYFFKAFRLNKGQQVSTVLAMEIGAVYQELGQYLQAGMIIKSVLEQEDLIHDFDLKQKLKSQLVYIDTLVELLRIAKIPNAPYSKIPNLIKMKASIETSAKLINLTKEAG